MQEYIDSENTIYNDSGIESHLFVACLDASFLLYVECGELFPNLYQEKPLMMLRILDLGYIEFLKEYIKSRKFVNTKKRIGEINLLFFFCI